MQGNAQVQRRRTFAIIAHPDAGKTTLTEKLLLFGGAVQMAGQVKAKKGGMQTRSDWMGIERERGISVVTSVMTFEYRDCVFNLLDTPGHEDFADDTYRTLTAVDSAVVVLDGAKGVEPRTLKLFEVCRLRNIPIVVFINKMDREARDPIELLDEIEDKLALDTTPVNWPIGFGKNFSGLYALTDRKSYQICREDKSHSLLEQAAHSLGHQEKKDFVESVELVLNACKAFSRTAYLEGHMAPVFFGSALRNIGVADVLDALVEFAPAPRAQLSDTRLVEASEEKLTGFVFKIQANMDPNHRDRIAFFRVCSGKLVRGMKAYLPRTAKAIPLSVPQFFFARSRELVEIAYAGDVVGIPNHGSLRIGDTLTEGEGLRFQGIPNFAPEIFRRVRLQDAMKAKKLKDALQQMAEEGVIQLFVPEDGSPVLVGAVGALQIDVLRERLAAEYTLSVTFETARFSVCRWMRPKDKKALEEFVQRNKSSIARDVDADLVFLAENDFALNYEKERAPDIEFTAVKDYQISCK